MKALSWVQGKTVNTQTIVSQGMTEISWDREGSNSIPITMLFTTPHGWHVNNILHFVADMETAESLTIPILATIALLPLDLRLMTWLSLGRRI